MTANAALVSQVRELLAESRYDQASELCIEALRQAPAEPTLLMLLALADEGRGDLAGARARLEAALDADPQHVESRYQLGRLQLVAGEIEPARELFRSCLAQNPNHAPSYTALARLDHAEGRVDQAIEGLRTALRADEDHVPALTSLAMLLLEQGDYEAANGHASHALKLAPDSPASQLTMGQVLLAQGYLSFAEQCLANAAARDPDNPRVHLAMALLLQRLERHRDALRALQAAERLGHTGPALKRARAQSLARLGRFAEARAALEALLQQSGGDTALLIALIDVLAALGDEPALLALRGRIGADYPGLEHWLEACRASLSGQPARALEWLEAGRDKADQALAARVPLFAAELLLHLGRGREVTAWIEPLLRPAAQDAALSWQIASLARSAGNRSLAVAVLETLEKTEGLNDDARARTAVMLADLHDQDGRFEEAAARFPAAAWQAPYVGGLANPDKPEQLDFDRLLPWRWTNEAFSAGRPVFILGWPCSGRDLLLVALAQAGLPALPLADWPLRRSQLGLPGDVDDLEQLDDSRRHIARRRYLRAVGGRVDVVEPAAVLARDLALLARVFPGATVIRPRAEEDYLALQWRLAGYRQVPTMRKLWRHEQGLLDQLTPGLPLRLVDVHLADLLAAPDDTLQSLCAGLGLAWQDRVATTVQAMMEERGYRPPAHWRLYPDGAI